MEPNAAPDRDPTPAVELHDVCKAFAGQVILDKVNLTVPRGQFFALLGPSGSGKSTLLKLVSGIELPDQGRVRLAGRDVTELPAYRRPVHTVFQSYALFPHLDVAGNVGFPLRVAGVPRGEREARVLRALGWVRMEKFAARRVTELSGGERQRVALARALVDEPECVLLDEPLSALDPHLRGQTLELLQETQARLGATYLYVTHDREEALRAAHRVGVLHRGRLQQIGAPEEIYRHPVNAFVAGFIGPISWLPGELVPAVPDKSGRVVVGVRPEDVRLDPQGPLAGRVVARQFAGATVSLRLALAGDCVLAAEVRAGCATPEIGDTIRVSWEPGAAHLFPAEEVERSQLS